MNWFKKMVIRWVREDWENAGKTRRYVNDSPEIASSTDDSAGGDPILQFRVYSAVGGKIVEFRRYDRKNGNHEFTSYIVTEDQNFGERIAKIASLEVLK